MKSRRRIKKEQLKNFQKGISNMEETLALMVKLNEALDVFTDTLFNPQWYETQRMQIKRIGEIIAKSKEGLK
ncbi:MAG: hypothetical protein KGJ13_03450 [Patescibacteria group bacterium]|nr:hypothetical protein [Patescibacteria group bacterium]